MSVLPTANRSESPATAHASRPLPRDGQRRPAGAELTHAQRVAYAVSRAPGWTRSDLREDMRSTAMLAYLETRQHFDERRGVPPLGHAFPRMRGSVLDLLRRERRQFAVGQDDVEAATTLDTERVRARLTVERLLAATARDLTRDEQVVLHEVYLRGRQLNDVGDEHGWSKSQGVRRNQSLLDRLRRAAGVSVATPPDDDTDVAPRVD